MTEPLVTIVITSYNYAQCIGDAITSALAQTYRNLDILVLDNASTDDSLQVIEAFADERLRVVVHSENIGIQRNHNFGIREARGEYVVFLSADDMLLPTLVEDSLAYRRAHPEVDVPYFSVAIAGADGRVSDYFEHQSFDGADYYLDRNELANQLTRDNCMYMPTMLFPRAVFEELGPLDEDLGILLDYEFDLRMAAAGKRFAFVSKPGAIIRFHGENRSGVKRFVATGQQLREFCTILERYTQPVHHPMLLGYGLELRRMIETKVREMQGPFPAEFAEQETELAPLVARVRASIDTVPAIGAETARGRGLVSVVVPTYGRIGDLDRALRSLRAQEYENWEAIVACDGGPDPSGVVAHLGLGDRVRVSRLRRSRGPSAARNLALHGVRGEIVAYLDDDNLFAPGYLGAVAAAFAEPSTNVTAARARRAVMAPAGAILLIDEPRLDLEADGSVSLVSNALALNAITHRRACLPVAGYFNEGLALLEDWEFLVRLNRPYSFWRLDADGPVLGHDVGLLRGHIFGRRNSAQWSEYAMRLADIYKAFPPPTSEHERRRGEFSASLQGVVNRGVGSAGRPEDVLAFAKALAGLSAKTTA